MVAKRVKRLLQCGRPVFNPRGSGRTPGEGNGKPTAVLLHRKFNGQRSLVNYSAWVCKVSNMTEQIHHSRSRWLATSCCKVSWWYFSLKQSKAGFALHIQWALSMGNFAVKRYSVCTLGVSWHSSKCAGKYVILKVEIQVIWKNQYISPVKAGY